MDPDDLDLPPAWVSTAPEPSIETFAARFASAVGVGVLLLLVLAMLIPVAGVGLGLVIGCALGYRMLRGCVPARAEGWLITTGFVIANAALIPT